MSESTADARRVAPNHLSEVTPSSIEGGIVVGVLGFFFVPAVSGSPSKLDPLLESGWGRSDGGEIATRAVLCRLVSRCEVVSCITHMLGLLGAGLDVLAGGIGKLGIPD